MSGTPCGSRLCGRIAQTPLRLALFSSPSEVLRGPLKLLLLKPVDEGGKSIFVLRQLCTPMLHILVVALGIAASPPPVSIGLDAKGVLCLECLKPHQRLASVEN